MKKVVAVVLLLAMIVTVSPLAAQAHGAAAAALALGAFATFSILTAPFWAWAAYPVYPYPSPYYPPATYYAPSYSALPAEPVTSYSAPAPTTPAVQREVVYPHGRHVLYGDGVTTAYQWVWLPNPPQPPAPALAPPPVATTPPPSPSR
jgi:hypothetical protein